MCFNRPDQLNNTYSDYIINMYDIGNVYEELNENILFVQSKILESYWTINTLNKTNFFNNEISSLDIESNLIDFYNKLFDKFKLEILDKYADVYALRRTFIINRFSHMGSKELEYAV